MSIRKIKNRLLRLLTDDQSIDDIFQTIRCTPKRQLVNPLFGFFYNGSPHIRWRAISVMGRVVASLADENIESARIIMRRLMWNLNDESGGIGWGSPEALGEIMAQHKRLADEFSAILISYINPCGNFLEHEVLQQGVLWGAERLFSTRPHLAKEGTHFLPRYLLSEDPILKGYAVRAASPILNDTLTSIIETFLNDPFPMTIYVNDVFETRTIGELSRQALNQFSQK